MARIVHFSDDDGRAALVEYTGIWNAEQLDEIQNMVNSFHMCEDTRETASQIRATRLPISDTDAPVLFRNPAFVLYDRVCHMRRSVGFFSNTSIEGYAYSMQVMPAQRLPPWMSKIMDRTNSVLGTKYNGILVNHYADGNEEIMPHSDDERSLNCNDGVASLSIGAVRDFVISDKTSGKRKCVVSLIPGSLVVMEGPEFQKRYKHAVPKRKLVKEPRTSFTFRNFVA